MKKRDINNIWLYISWAVAAALGGSTEACHEGRLREKSNKLTRSATDFDVESSVSQKSAHMFKRGYLRVGMVRGIKRWGNR